jgi:hypothetical protein
VPTTTADDVAVAGTDYRYQGMADTFIANNTIQRDAAVRQGIDAQGGLAAGFMRMNMEAERFGSMMSVATAVQCAGMIGMLDSINGDIATALVKMGLNLSNSASAPVPSNPFGATGGAGSGLNFNLPKGMTVTQT